MADMATMTLEKAEMDSETASEVAFAAMAADLANRISSYSSLCDACSKLVSNFLMFSSGSRGGYGGGDSYNNGFGGDGM